MDFHGISGHIGLLYKIKPRIPIPVALIAMFAKLHLILLSFENSKHFFYNEVICFTATQTAWLVKSFKIATVTKATALKVTICLWGTGQINREGSQDISFIVSHFIVWFQHFLFHLKWTANSSATNIMCCKTDWLHSARWCLPIPALICTLPEGKDNDKKWAIWKWALNDGTTKCEAVKAGTTHTAALRDAKANLWVLGAAGHCRSCRVRDQDNRKVSRLHSSPSDPQSIAAAWFLKSIMSPVHKNLLETGAALSGKRKDDKRWRKFRELCTWKKPFRITMSRADEFSLGKKKKSVLIHPFLKKMQLNRNDKTYQC